MSPLLLIEFPGMEENEYTALFGSVTRVMRAEKVLKKEGIGFILIPSPSGLHSPCGLAIRFPGSSREALESALERKGIRIKQLFLKTVDGYKEVVR